MSLLVAEREIGYAKAWAAARGLTPRRVTRSGVPHWKWDSPHDFAPGAEHTLPEYLWRFTPIAFGKPMRNEEGAWFLLAHGLRHYDELVRQRKGRR